MCIIFIVYSYTCDSFDCKLWKNSHFTIKSSQSKPNLYGISCNWLVLFMYRLGNHMIEHIFLLVENVLEYEVKVVLTFL